MDVIELHRRAAERFEACVGGIESDQWGLPTPCPEWDVRALLEHVTGNHQRMALLLNGHPVDHHDGLALAWSTARTALQTGLALPGALDRQGPSPFGGQAAISDLMLILTTDLTTHTWDLARAVGADETLDHEVVAEILPIIERMHPVLITSGKFAPPVPVPKSAGPQQRLLGLLGRSEL